MATLHFLVITITFIAASIPRVPDVVKNTTILNFASYIITQNALTDAPYRYSHFIQEAIDWLDAETWPDQQQCASHCCTKGIIYLSQGTHTFKIVEPNGIILTILSNGFSVVTKWSITINCPVYVRAGEHMGWPINGCLWTDTICNHDASSITGDATTSMNVSIVWDTSLTPPELNITAGTPNVQLSNIRLSSSCSDLNYLMEAFNNAQSCIISHINKAITQAINQWAQQVQTVFNVPQSFQAYPGVNITYYITDLQFSAKQWANISANGYLTAQNPKNKQWVNYTDQDINDAAMKPPDWWPWDHLIYQNQTINGKTHNERLWLLNGLRVTSTLLTGLVWAANMIGDLTPSYNFTALDATLIFNLTWDKPLLGIPFNDTLSVEMGYGIVNGTCYQTSIGPPLHNETVIISFYFTNLKGNGTVQLDVNASNVSLAIQVSDFNVSALNPVLIKPKLPLPTDVIENMMSTLINDSIPLINAYLMEHAMNIPKNFSQWVPNPQLTLIHQDGCCNGQHGYMQFYSMCSCDENNPLWSSCTNLPCIPTPKPTPPPSVHVAPLLLIPDTAKHNYNNKTVQYQLWVNLYSNNKTGLCSFMNIGDVAGMILLNNTNGECVKTLAPISPATQYYSLTMTSSNTIKDIKLLCNQQCNACKWPSILNTETIKFRTCYPFTTESSIMFEEKKSTPCIGGNVLNSSIQHNQNVVIITYNNSKNCRNSTIITVQNMGNIYDKCIPSLDDPNAYNMLNDQNVTAYNLGMNCSLGCKHCSISYQQIEYDTCFLSNKPNVSMKFMFVYDTQVCGYPDNNDHPQATTNAILIILFIIIILLIIIIFIGICIKRIQQLNKLKNGCCDKTKCDKLKCNYNKIKICCNWVFNVKRDQFKKWIIDSFDHPKNIYYRLTTKLKVHNILLISASVFIYIELIAWHFESPWKVFDTSSFDRIGIPSDVLDTTNLNTVLNDWQYFAEIYFGIFATFLLCCVAFRFICIRKCCCFDWYQFRVLLLSIYIIFVFIGIYLFCPTFYEFTNSIKLNPNNQNTLTSSSDIEDTVNELIGWSFVGVFLSYYSNVLLFWMHSIPVGVYIASLFYVYFLFDYDNFEKQINDDEKQQQNVHDKAITSTKYCCLYMLFCRVRMYSLLKKLFKYNVVRQDIKSTMIARLIVIVFVLQSMASCIESLPVIIMYQSFGSNIAWLLAWLFWWLIPIILCMHLWYVCYKYIKLSRNNSLSLNQTLLSQRSVIYNGLAEVSLFFIVLIVSIVAESHKTDIAVWFLILTGFTALIISAILWIFVLHFMFANVKSEQDQNNTAKNNNNCKHIKEIAAKLNEYRINNSDGKLDRLLSIHSSLDAGNMNETEPNEEKQQTENSHSRATSIAESYVSLDMKHYQRGYCCCLLYWWLFEKREIQNPSRFGERIYLRRLFLWLGTGSFGYISINYFVKVLNITVKQAVINFFNDLNAGVTWPDDDNGGTLFDPTFKIYNTARVISAASSLVGFILFSFSLLADFMYMEKKGLKLSRVFGWLSIIALMVGIFGPSIPNYLSSTPIHQICPYCAPQFNNAIYLLFGDIVGLFCSGLFVIQMLPIVVGAVIPAIARSSYMVLHYHKLYKLDLNEQDTIRYIFIFGSLLGPFTTFAPLIVYQQFMGDVMVSVLLMMFWIIPICIAINIKTKNCTRVYLSYMTSYYGILLMIFIYHWAKYGLPRWIIIMMETPHWIIETILEIIAEVCLTNVLLSDFLYTIIMGFRTKHIQS